MVTQAAGFAVLAALSPTALLVAAVFLGGANPRRIVVLYLAGAICMTAIMAAIVYFVLRAGHLYKPRERQARYYVRLGLGLLCLIAAVHLVRRAPRRRPVTKQGKGLVSRLTARPRPATAFIAGLIIYAPSLTFVAAVQAVATADVSATRAVLALLLIIAITVAFVWLPLVLYLLAPARTTALLGSFNTWLRTHGFHIVVCALAVGGVLLTISGIRSVA